MFSNAYRRLQKIVIDLDNDIDALRRQQPQETQLIIHLSNIRHTAYVEWRNYAESEVAPRTPANTPGVF